jgi:hypothetical protein
MAYQIGHTILMMGVLVGSIFITSRVVGILARNRNQRRPVWVDYTIGILVFITSIMVLTWIVFIIE